MPLIVRFLRIVGALLLVALGLLVQVGAILDIGRGARLMQDEPDEVVQVPG